MSEVTVLLREWRGGDARAMDQLLPLVYDTLRHMASARMRQAAPSATLQPTAVVNEALLRMLGRDADWNDRAHFLAIAALKMRAVLVDHARARAAEKRGGAPTFVTLSQADAQGGADAGIEVLGLHLALEQLADAEPRAARALEMAYFGGMERDEIAVVLGVSVPTVDRDLRFAKAWLNKALA